MVMMMIISIIIIIIVIEVVVLWVVTPCSVVVGYQRFVGRCYFHLQGSPKLLLSNHHTTRRGSPENHDFFLHCREKLKSSIRALVAKCNSCPHCCAVFL
jgi:hypothetical protein